MVLVLILLQELVQAVAVMAVVLARQLGLPSFHPHPHRLQQQCKLAELAPLLQGQVMLPPWEVLLQLATVTAMLVVVLVVVVVVFSVSRLWEKCSSSHHRRHRRLSLMEEEPEEVVQQVLHGLITVAHLHLLLRLAATRRHGKLLMSSSSLQKLAVMVVAVPQVLEELVPQVLIIPLHHPQMGLGAVVQQEQEQVAKVS